MTKSEESCKPSPPRPMIQQRRDALPISSEMEIRSKQSHRYLTPVVPEERRARMNLKVAPFMASLTSAVASPMTDLPIPTPSVPAPKDKRIAHVVPPMSISPVFSIERGKTQEKLIVDYIHAAPIVDTLQYFPQDKEGMKAVLRRKWRWIDLSWS